MTPLLQIIVTALTSFGICLYAIPAIINVCEKKHLFDVPCTRKQHQSATPTMGGLAIFAGFVFSVTFWANQSQIKELQYIICATLVIFFIGLKDDIMEVSPTKKMIGQLFSAMIIVLLADIRLTSFYGIFGIYEIAYLPSAILSLFTVIAITNSFNLIDGVDGLASSIGILSVSIFGTWFYLAGHYQYAIISFGLIGSLVAFFIFNKHPAKIFMGDTGSLILGLICSVLAIKFIEFNRTYMGPKEYKILSVPAVAISILIIPLFDTLQVIAFRLINKKSPFYPDRNHLHHILSTMKFSDRKICTFLIGINIVIFVFSFLFQQETAEIIVLSYLTFLAVLVLTCRLILKKNSLNND